jgi:Na+-driven multidrug efflux pump
VGILYQVYLLSKGNGRIKILREHLHINLKIMLNIMRIAGNGTLQFMITTASWVLMVRMIQSFGSAATAGYTVAIRIVIFSIYPSWGLGSAAATLVGQNLGAKQPERAAQSVWRAGFFNMIFLGVISLIFLAFAPQLVGIFSTDPLVIKFGADCLRIISLCYGLYAYGLVVLQAFNGAGDTFTPSVINLICYWAVQLPLAYLLGRHYHLGPNGIYTAILVAEILLSSISIYVFRLGRWKLKVV